MAARVRFCGCAIVAVLLFAAPAGAAEWRADLIPTSSPVTAVETVNGTVFVVTAAGWLRAATAHGTVTLEATVAPAHPPLPPDALPDGRVASGIRTIARAWLAEPTKRYDHGVLGDAIEAGAMVIERRDGKREVLRLPDDAVFEDLVPRIADLGDGHDSIVVVKSTLSKGAALAVIGERDGRFQVIAETPPLGGPHRWLDPAGIADFDGDGLVDIALVAMPHVVGRLELWSWHDGRLVKTQEVKDTSNHAIGSRALMRSAVADFDGDEVADLAIPTFDRRAVRLLAFNRPLRELARVALPAQAATDFGLLRDGNGRPLVLVGLADGTLAAVRR